jgi:hypothetical protein
MIQNGVKTRVPLEHTCGLGVGEIPAAPLSEGDWYSRLPRKITNTIVSLSDYQISELGSYFRQETEITKIGVVVETGDIIVEYEYVGPFPTCIGRLQTIKIPKIKP